MKKLIISILFLNTFSLKAQLDYNQERQIKKEVEADMKHFGAAYVESKKYFINQNKTHKSNFYSTLYDTLNKVTYINFDKKKKISIPGSWNLINRSEFNIDSYVSHCPMVYNENGVIMEYAIWDYDPSYKKFKDSYEKLKFNKESFEKQNMLNSKGYKKIKYDSIQNYCLYKKKELNPTTNQLLDVYYLLGVKAKKSFHIAIFNFKEEDYENMEEFIIQCYTMNR